MRSQLNNWLRMLGAVALAVASHACCATAQTSTGTPPSSPQVAQAATLAPGSQGAFQWQFPHDQRGVDDVTMVQAAIAAQGNHVFVPLAGGAGRNGVACLEADVQTQTSPPAAWVYKTSHPVVNTPAVLGEMLLLVDGRAGDKSRHLQCVRIADQKPAWQVAIEENASGQFGAQAGAIVIQSEHDAIRCLDEEGRLIWQRRIGRLTRPPALGESRICLVHSALAEDGRARPETDGEHCTLLRRDNGDTLASHPAPDKVVAGPVMLAGRMWVGTGRGLRAFELERGERVSKHPAAERPVRSDFAASDNRLAFLDDRQNVCAIDVRAEGDVAVLTGGHGNLAPCIVGNSLVWSGEDAIWLADLAAPGSPPRVWADLSWLGAPATSPVWHRGRLYLGVPRWGLVSFGVAGPAPK